MTGGIRWDTYQQTKNWNARADKSDLPGTGATRTGESDSRYRLDQGGLARALRTDHCDHREVNIRLRSKGTLVMYSRVLVKTPTQCCAYG